MFYRRGRHEEKTYPINDILLLSNNASNLYSRYHDSIADYHEGNAEAIEEGRVYLLPERCASIEKQNKSTQVDARRVASWHNRQRSIPHTRRAFERSRKKRRRSHRQNVFSKPESRLHSHTKRKEESHRNRGRDVHGGSGEGIKRNSESGGDLEGWDDWTNWSECSVSCGCGRQVRWRHCHGEDCVKGMKKAQIKICHIRDCDSQSFLKWIGVKPK